MSVLIDKYGDPIWPDVSKFSAEWRRRHRRWWLRKYPQADSATRRNLAALINWAESCSTEAQR